MGLFEEFDSQFDLKGIQEDMEAAKSQVREYESVPYGEYEVALENCEMKLTKKTNKPMISMWFRITEGDYKRQFIFSNRVLIPKNPDKTAAVLAMAKEFFDKLQTGVDTTFESFSQYEQVCMDIAEAAEDLVYHINYRQNNAGFDVIDVLEVFEIEN